MILIAYLCLDLRNLKPLRARRARERDNTPEWISRQLRNLQTAYPLSFDPSAEWKRMDAAPLYDVIATNIKTREVRILAENLRKEDAEAFLKLRAYEWGTEVEFFSLKDAPPRAPI